jgi:hypothetical protein
VFARAGWRMTAVGRLPLAHSGNDRPAQLLCQPQFNERLAAYHAWLDYDGLVIDFTTWQIRRKAQ